MAGCETCVSHQDNQYSGSIRKFITDKVYGLFGIDVTAVVLRTSQRIRSYERECSWTRCNNLWVSALS